MCVCVYIYIYVYICTQGFYTDPRLFHSLDGWRGWPWKDDLARVILQELSLSLSYDWTSVYRRKSTPKLSAVSLGGWRSWPWKDDPARVLFQELPRRRRNLRTLRAKGDPEGMYTTLTKFLLRTTVFL